MTIERHTGKNFAVITALQLIAFDNILNVPAVDENYSLNFSEITLASGTNWETINGVHYKTTFTENETDSAAGNFFNKSIAAQVSKIRSEVVVALKRYERRKLAAIITDANGASCLVYPLRMKRSKSLPGNPTALNHIALAFTGSGVNESPFVNMGA